MNHPKRLLPFPETGEKIALRIDWEDGQGFALPYFELRYACPCAACVDEKTGERTLKKSQIRPDIQVRAIQPVGNYAIRIQWNDGHSTGMYHFERLAELCRSQGRAI